MEALSYNLLDGKPERRNFTTHERMLPWDRCQKHGACSAETPGLQSLDADADGWTALT